MIKTAVAIVLSPLTGLAIALLLVLIISWVFLRAVPARVDAPAARQCADSAWLRWLLVSNETQARAELRRRPAPHA